jgi:hypothetical protein
MKDDALESVIDTSDLDSTEIFDDNFNRLYSDIKSINTFKPMFMHRLDVASFISIVDDYLFNSTKSSSCVPEWFLNDYSAEISRSYNILYNFLNTFAKVSPFELHWKGTCYKFSKNQSRHNTLRLLNHPFSYDC